MKKRRVCIPENQQPLKFFTGKISPTTTFVEKFSDAKTANCELYDASQYHSVYEYDPRDIRDLDCLQIVENWSDGDSKPSKLKRCPLESAPFCGIDLIRAASHRKWICSAFWNAERRLFRFNFAALLLLDVLLGVYLRKLIAVDRLDSSLSEKVDESAFQLAEGLEWISNNPGGLKINPKMAFLISKFCYHHVQIWQGYCLMIIDYSHWFITVVRLISPLGISFSLALFSDLFMLTTLHFYCFYVYMLRVYRFWVLTLRHLLNLFFGKKLNPLMACRDSIFNEQDDSPNNTSAFRLTVGSLIFSVFTFLFPTIILYYCCFCSIRFLQSLCRAFIRKIGDVFVDSFPLIHLNYFFLSRWSFGAELKILGTKLTITPVLPSKFIARSNNNSNSEASSNSTFSCVLNGTIF